MKLLLKKEKDSQKNIHREIINVQLFIARRIYVSLSARIFFNFKYVIFQNFCTKKYTFYAFNLYESQRYESQRYKIKFIKNIL